MPHSNRSKFTLLMSTIIGVVLVTGVFAVLHHDDGTNIASFYLIDQYGVATSQDDLAGRYLLTFFGFTSCPRICPTQMAKITTAMVLLERDGTADRITPVFISVDPVRDEPETIRRYLSHFYPGFVGLTGSQSALESAARSFSAVFSTSQDQPGNQDLQVTHSAFLYLVDPEGRILDYIPASETAEATAERVRNLLQPRNTARKIAPADSIVTENGTPTRAAVPSNRWCGVRGARTGTSQVGSNHIPDPGVPRV